MAIPDAPSPRSLPPAVALGVIVALVFIATAGLRWTGLLQWVELRAYDQFLLIRASEPPNERPVTVVAVREDDVSQFGWPLPDGVLADILGSLLVLEPEVVGVDIYRDVPVGDGAEVLAEALTMHPEVVWITKFGADPNRAIPAPAVLHGSDRVGFSDVIPDSDGTIRRAFLFLDDGVDFEFSFSLRLALRYLAAQGIGPKQGEPDPTHIKLGSVTIPPFEATDGSYIDADALGYQYLLDYRYGQPSFLTFGLDQALSGQIPADAIRGRIVLVGVTAESVKDYFQTPGGVGRDGNSVAFGVQMHGEMTEQLIRHATTAAPIMRSLSELGEAGWILLWTLVGVVLAYRLQSPITFTVGLMLVLATLVSGSYLAFAATWWIPLVPAMFGAIASAGLGLSYMVYREQQEREAVMQLFSRHVSGAVAEEIWRRRDEVLENGRPKAQTVRATVLFADIRDSTKIAEQMDAATLMDWLNSYMESMAANVMNHGGIVDKYIGDSVMAVFGIPLPCDNEELISEQAQNAALCALAIAEDVKRVNAQWETKGFPQVQIRIGLHTGHLVAGGIGSADRYEYTVVGDTANTASRLEAFADRFFHSDSKVQPCAIAISSETQACLDKRFRTLKFGEVPLKGKSENVMVHQLVGFFERADQLER